ncbi:hypothetical protein JCM18750_39420 [Halostagnicola bangensis]
MLLAPDWGIDRIMNGVIYGLFGVHLVLVILAHATSSVPAWYLGASCVFLGGILGCRYAVESYQDPETIQSGILTALGFTLVILAVIYQATSTGFGFGRYRTPAVIGAFLLIVAFMLVVSDPRQFSIAEWAVFGCFVVLAGIYVMRTLAFHPTSAQARWPLWSMIVMGSSLFVIPNLVPERIFLWFLSRLAAVVVLVGLVTYVVGDYTVWIFEIQQWTGSPSVPGIDTDATTLRSIFPNPNSFGLLSFAGFIAAFVEFHRSVVTRRPLGSITTLVLTGICGLGLFLSNARAAMLAAAVAAAIYAVYAVGGRITVPITVIAGSLGVCGLLVGMYANVIDISATNRFELWRGSLAAFRDGPLLFGHGNLSPNNAIEPYLAGDLSTSPHNSYLSILVQTGIVGGLAYFGIVAGSIVAGLINFRDVNVAMLALAIGWAVHQMFESYTLFRWSLGAVIATMTIGYLLQGVRSN